MQTIPAAVANEGPGVAYTALYAGVYMFYAYPPVPLFINNDSGKGGYGSGVVVLEAGDQLTHTHTTSTFLLGLARLGDELTDE